jgi:general secretion pathway protein D
MKTFTRFLLCCILFAAVPQVYSQASRDARLKTKGYINPQEIVSLDSTMRMDQAMLVIGELSKQFAGKIIIDLEKRTNPIGVYIVNQHWRDALDMILAHNGLTYVEEADYIRIAAIGSASVTEKLPGAPVGEPAPTLEARDIRISAVFFTANTQKLQQWGISWDFFRSKSKEPSIQEYVNLGLLGGDTTAAIPPSPAGKGKSSLDNALTVLHTPPEFTFANIDALAKFFSTNQLGEVITSPELIVRNGRKGRIQVGQDIFITTRDVAGNAINQQLSTGTIIEVTPMVYNQNDTDIVYLDLAIEQSDAAPGPVINRTSVKTYVLLYNGEETVIGGLYTTNETETREGIPFLKDLPPWFFGLRYLFGSESKFKQKNELIVLLKAELLAPIRGRMSTRTSQEDIILNKRKQNQREYDKK